jgi:hypothetical protein
MMTFAGRVKFRSSLGTASSGPPGESEIQRRNPDRVERIRAITGWDTLALGTLNLDVNESVLEQLGRLTPTLVEDATLIVYPAPYEHVPGYRRAYWYYLAHAEKGGVIERVLVRRAAKPVAGTVELFSAERLVTKLSLSEGDTVVVSIIG